MGNISTIDDLEKFVNDYVKNSHLEEVKYNPEVEEILNKESIADWDEQKCLSAAFVLSSYAFYLQGEFNRYSAQLGWCEDTLNKIIAKSYGNYDSYMKYEIRKASIINENSFALQINSLKENIQIKADLLHDKARDVRSMINILQEIAKRKAYK